MDTNKKVFEYATVLYRIGRRVGFKSESTHASEKMTFAEHVKLAGLFLSETERLLILDHSIIKNSGHDLLDMFLDDTDEAQRKLISSIKECYVEYYYADTEKLLSLIDRANKENSHEQ